MFLASFLSANPSTTEMAFFLSALGGTLFFVIRVLMILVVGVGAEDFDIDADGDIDASEAGADTDAAFKLFSFNTVAVFIMMFGWSGLSAYMEFKLGTFVSLGLAAVVGLAMMYLTAWLLLKMKGLRSPGDVFNIEKAVGQKAEVYQRIPSGGVGKVQINLEGVLREIEAESVSEEEIPSFSFVTITGVRSGNRVLVKSVSE